VSLIRHRAVAVVTAGLAAAVATGCASRADVYSLDRAVRDQIIEQRRQIQSLQREVERLRADVDEGGGGGRGRSDDRIAQLETRIAALERGAGVAPPPVTPTEEQPPAEGLPPEEPPPATLPPPPPPPPSSMGGDDALRRDVAQEQGAADEADGAERQEYQAAMTMVASGQCPRAVQALNAFAAKHKESPLADNALYWAARCHAARRDQNQAISKFYEVVTRYPKGDKAAAALWAQGNLFIDMGNTPDARIVLGKLIREHPASEEAARARQKLNELKN
jgi:tol-pal system protein YbgF